MATVEVEAAVPVPAMASAWARARAKPPAAGRWLAAPSAYGAALFDVLAPRSTT